MNIVPLLLHKTAGRRSSVNTKQGYHMSEWVTTSICSTKLVHALDGLLQKVFACINTAANS